MNSDAGEFVLLELHTSFSLWDGSSITFVSGCWQEGRWKNSQPRPCPFIHTSARSWQCYFGLIQHCYFDLCMQSIQTLRRTQDLVPLRLLLQAQCVPKHNKSPITTEHTYSCTFAEGISARLLSLNCSGWCVFVLLLYVLSVLLKRSKASWHYSLYKSTH